LEISREKPKKTSNLKKSLSMPRTCATRKDELVGKSAQITSTMIRGEAEAC